MEERFSPANYSNQDLGNSPRPPSSPPPPPPLPILVHGAYEPQDGLRSGTYVVQVPKEQIYRVPPPENAAYLDRHRRNPKKSSSFSKRCCIIFPSLVLLLLVVIFLVVAGITYLIMKPKDVQFTVQNINVVTSHHHHLEYDVTLNVENPNGRMGVNHLEGGDASLSFKQHKISTGHPPAFSTDSKTSKRVKLVLTEMNGDKLPSELQKSIEGKGKKEENIALSLLINIPVKMEIGLLTTWTMNMAITCDVMVNTLGKGTRVSSQKCHTKVNVF